MTRGHGEGGGIRISITGHGVTGLAATPRLAPLTADTPLYIKINLTTLYCGENNDNSTLRWLAINSTPMSLCSTYG